MLNQCTFLGYLTQKPELRTISSGAHVVSFSIAVSRDRPNPAGDWVTDFIDCAAWNKLAEKICEKYDKGDLLTVSGRLQNRPQTDKDGNRVVIAEIFVLDCRKVYIKNPAASEPGPSMEDGDFQLLEGKDSDLPF